MSKTPKATTVRSTGSATINFGLVAIPVKFYPAVESATGVGMNLLHDKCNSRVKQQYVCSGPCSGVVVSREEMIKGYEYVKGSFVTFTADEFKALEEMATGAVEIVSFLPANAVDPIYYDKPYYVAADKGGAKALSLLLHAMIAAGRVGLGRYAARGKQHIVLLRPIDPDSAGNTSGGGMIMQQLLYADEVRDHANVPFDEVVIKPAEAAMAARLVDHLAADKFDPMLFRDEAKARILAAIACKVEGTTFVPPTEAVAAPETDLMASLMASLGGK